MTLTDRRAARVLLIDAAGRALLFHGLDPARPGEGWWITPGGGLEAGETPAQGAARELLEETGLRVDPADLGEPVHRDVVQFSFDHRAFRQEQDFFLYRVPEWQVDTAGFDTDERRSIDEHRWWSAAEIDAADERIYPAGLAGLLRTLTVQDGVEHGLYPYAEPGPRRDGVERGSPRDELGLSRHLGSPQNLGPSQNLRLSPTEAERS